ncbi:unnamed protein product [Ectocarpus sp. 6 AP-2014]
MAGPDGNQYESYQNESETTTLLSPSPPSSPARGRDKQSASATPEEDVRKHYKYALGTGYMFAMGVCGIVLVALGSTLDDLADNCDTTATDVGSVFIARGVGAVLGAVVSSKLYLWMRGNNVMSIVLLLLTAVLIYMPFITSVYTLHFAFFVLGLCTAITDTGCQIMTRKLHGAKAGPWLGANTVVFGISGALVPLIGYLTGSLFVQYIILSAVSCATAVFLIILPAPEKYEGLLEERKKMPERREENVGVPGESSTSICKMAAFYRRYKIEFHISGMVFCLIGGKVGATAYLESYVDDTDVIDESHAELLIVVLWTAITIGRLAGLQDQRHLTLPRLYRHSTILFLCGAAAAATILVFQSSAFVLWTGIAAYGLYNGPTVGYCYDLNNRVTMPSEMGMSVVMFGLNFGASIVPYVISWVWDYTGSPETLIVIIMLSHLLPYPLMLNAKRIDEANKRKLREEAITPSLSETRSTPSFSV